MTSTLNALAAQEHVTDLRRNADRSRVPVLPESDGVPAALELRLSSDSDAWALHRLAELDDADPLDGEVLIALVEGVAVAALSLSDRRVIANPFLRTRDAVVLLRMHADHLFGRRERRRLRGFPRLRFA